MMIEEINIITPWYNTFSGGAEVAARTLAEECVKRGLKATVLTTCCKSPYDDWWKDSIKPGEELVNGVKVKRFRLSTIGKEKYEAAIVKQIHGEKLTDEDKKNFFTYGISSEDLVKYIPQIKKGAPIIAIPYFQALAHNVIINNPGRVSMIPCFHDEEQFYWEEISQMIKYSDKIFYLSEPEKDMVIRNYGLKYGRKVIESIVLGVGVELDSDKISSGRKKFKDIKLPESYMVYVGRKDIGKGVGKLVEYHKKLNTKLPLVFLGGGDKNLIPQNDSRFIDLGFVDEDLKYAIIEKAEALINLSENESFSLVIMEAWLTEVPVIVSANCAVTKYHCEKSNGGFWINNETDYGEVIQYIIDNKENSKKMGLNGKAYVQRNYSWDHIIHSLISEYK